MTFGASQPMPTPPEVEQFINRFRTSGLADAQATPSIERLAQVFSEQVAEVAPSKWAQSFAKWMVKQGRWTRYQADELLENDHPVLRIDSFVLRQKLESGVLSGWFAAEDPKGRRVLLRLLNEALHGADLSADNKRRLLRYQKAWCDQLLRIEGPFESPQGSFVVAQLPSGKFATKHVANGPMRSRQAALIASDLMRALEHLHANNLLARPDGLDRVWIADNESAILICDPLKDASVHEPDEPGLFRATALNNPVLAAQYSAPELFLKDAVADAATDIYAVGCLAYYLRFCEPPFSSTSLESLKKQHNDQCPDRLERSLKLGEEANPFFRVLAHCLAKNRQTRFSAAADASRAFLVAVASLGMDPMATPESVANVISNLDSEILKNPRKPKRPIDGTVEAKPGEWTVVEDPTPVENVAQRTVRVSEKIETPKAKPAATPNAPPQQPVTAGPVTGGPVTGGPVTAGPVAAGPVTKREANVASANVTLRDVAPVQPSVTPPQEIEPPSVPSLSTPAPASSNPVPASIAPASIAPASIAPASIEALEEPSKAKGTSSVRRKKKKKKNLTGPLVLGSMGFLLMILIVLVLIRGGGSGGQPVAEGPRVPPPPPPTEFRGSADRPAPTAAESPSSVGSGTQPNTKPAYQFVDDDRTLWAAPTAGDSPALRLLPPGSPMVVTFRPDSIGPSGTGASLYSAFEPELSAAWQALEKRAGVPLSDVERVTMGIVGTSEGQVTASLAIELKLARPISELAERWQVSAARTGDGATIYVSSNPNADAYYFDPQDPASAKYYAVASVEAIKEIAELEGGSIPLPPNLNDLWKGVGERPAFALLTTTNFLFADGRSMLSGYASEFVDPLRKLLLPDASGLTIRMDFDPAWFAEVRLTPGGGISPASLKKRLDDSLQLLPETAEQFIINTTPHPSWRALAIRLPGMMRALQTATRTGIIDGNATANFYLPSNAAPNILLASLLASNTPAGSSSVAVASNNSTSAPSLKTVDELLATKMRISFAQESLEMASRTVQDQFNASAPTGSLPLRVVLIGSDLQLEGITQNQQIRKFEHPDSTLQTVLDDLVRRANPDQTATELYQDAQKLLWVVGADPDDPTKPAVIITVRSQAMKKKLPLPPQFVPPTS
jgi:serine/threonine protein kinase